MIRGVPPDTPRLRFRELEHDDLDFIAGMMAHPEVMRFYPKLLTREESLGWIDRQRARYEVDGHGLWMIEDAGSGEPIGQVGLVTQELTGFPKPRYPEIGYLLHRPHWGRGFATEAALGVRSYAFDVLGHDEVISLIRPVNLPSQAVARRIGMTVRGTTTFKGFESLVFGLSHDS